MRCKACRNNGDIADNSSSYVKESGCTNYTLKSVKGYADSKQHRKVEDRIRNKARPLYIELHLPTRPEDAERASQLELTYGCATLTPSRSMGWPLALNKIAVNDFT